MARKTLGATFYGIAFSGLFLNASTAGLFSILPLYMRDVIGLSEMMVAQMDAVAELFAHGSRIFVGSVVDMVRTRKPILFWSILGLFASQAGFLFVWSAFSLLILRCAQRTFSGFIAVPRDVMVGSVLDAQHRARGYSLQRIFKTVGSVVGAGMVLPFFNESALGEGDVLRCVLVCLTFTLIALLLVVFVVKETKHVQARVKSGKFVILTLVRRLPKAYWRIWLISTLYHLGHFSETYLVFRMTDLGVPAYYIPFCPIAWSLGAVAMIYPMGILGDRFGIKKALIIAMLFMVVCNLCFICDSVALLFLGMLFWGVQTYSTQSLFAAAINGFIPENLRGTAFGVLYLTGGLSIVGASTWAGFLWEKWGHDVMFSWGGVVGLISILIVFFVFPKDE